jgi:hypothetical protein
VPEASKAEQFAIAAVAKHFSATWQPGDEPPAAYLMVGDRRIALDVAVVAKQRSGGKRTEKARLREDKVALRVLSDIESAVQAHVPAGKTLILTLGAPIKEPGKLVEALTKTLRTYIESGAEEIDGKKTILGNRVRFRVLNDGATWSAKAVGFVFSGDPAPGVLANAARSLRDEIAAKAKTRVPKTFSGERWLVLANEDWIADGKTYRRLQSLVAPSHHFARILMVLDSGRVEVLSELA